VRKPCGLGAVIYAYFFRGDVAFLLFVAALFVNILQTKRWLAFLPFLHIDREDARFVRDIKLLSKKLEKVVRIVSQIQDHLPKNISSRIEMDFRLADAELVLERALAYVD
jgi:hypothetical protein